MEEQLERLITLSRPLTPFPCFSKKIKSLVLIKTKGRNGAGHDGIIIIGGGE